MTGQLAAWRLPLGVVALGLCLLWAYWPTLGILADRWATDPQYSHGYLVPLFSLLLLWQRRGMLAGVVWVGNRWSIPLLLAGTALRLAGAYFCFDWLDAFSLPVCLAALAVLLGGWPCLLWSWPAVAFLGFMLPLPYRIEMALSYPLQQVATLASTYALQTLGFPALAEGNIILINDARIGVVEACSGLSMLMTFFALATAMTCLIQRPPLDKAVLIVSAAPIALAANVARITVTGMVHDLAGSAAANLIFHDLAGWLMMPAAVLLLWLELWVLGRLLVVPGPSRPVSLGYVPGTGSSPASASGRPTSTRDGACEKGVLPRTTAAKGRAAGLANVSSREAHD
jgi:exosortase